MRPESGRAEQAGFTLLEVLVALVITSLGLAVLVDAGLTGIGSAKLSDRYQEALARAQSHLAAVGPRPQPSDRQGDEADGFHWHVRIVQRAAGPVMIGAQGDLAHPPGRVALYDVSVGISWGRAPRRQLRLDAERISTIPPGRAP